MFKYVENELQEKMKELEEKNKIQTKKRSIQSEKVQRIYSYQDLMNYMGKTKISIAVSSLLVIIPIVLIYSGIWAFPALIISGLSAIWDGLMISEFVTSKKDLKGKFNDFSDLTKEEINDQMYDNQNLLSKMSSENIYLNLEIEKVRKQIIKVTQYKEALIETKKPIYQADTEQQYNFLKQSKDEIFNHLTSYLQEKVDYSNIHFDNSIDENIEYLENSKKLMKKM